MERGGQSPKGVLPLVALGFAIVWTCTLNVLTIFTWDYGKLGFFMILGLVLILLFARYVGSKLVTIRSSPSPMVNLVVCILAVGLLGYVFSGQWGLYDGNTGAPLKSDVANNTYFAGTIALGGGGNPYTSATQTGHRVENAPNVTFENGHLAMFGVPYYYGYPYFPGMFLSFEPFRQLDSSAQCIRTGNAFYYLLCLVGIGWLCALLAHPGYRVVAAILGVFCFAPCITLADELFVACLTDILIPVYLLAGFILLVYQRHSLSGIMFGWAFACKLLPGFFVALILTLWLWKKPERWKVLIPLYVTFVAVMSVYFFRDPAAFFSGTILYYLTEHARGDSTALWYFLPNLAKPIFQIIGYASIAYFIYRVARKPNLGLYGVLSACFIADILFVAFNRMAHTNYIWAIAPLGAVAVTTAILGYTEPVSIKRGATI